MSEPAAKQQQSNTSDSTEKKVKPCCVCTDEKSARDQCILLNGQDSGKCDNIISQYKSCMKGYGFEVN